MKHNLMLTAGSMIILREIIGLPGWTNKLDELADAGRLLKALPAEDLPQEMHRLPPNHKDVLAWTNRQLPEIQLEDSDRDLARKAVSFAVAQGAVKASPWATELLEVLGLVKAPNGSGEAKA